MPRFARSFLLPSAPASKLALRPEIKNAPFRSTITFYCGERGIRTPLATFNYGFNSPIKFIDPDGMEPGLYGIDSDELVKNGQAVRVQGSDLLVNKETGSILNREGGSSGVKFKSADETALAWAIDNARYAASGNNERAGTIYSQKSGKNGKTYSYNGSYGGGEKWSDYNEGNIPTGSTVEGLIHTHPRQNDFSTHLKFEDRNQQLDTDVMNYDENLYKDFYLVNPSGQLLVNRRAEQMMSNPGSRGGSQILVSGLKTGYYNFPLGSWRDGNNKPLKKGDVPELVRKLQKK